VRIYSGRVPDYAGLTRAAVLPVGSKDAPSEPGSLGVTTGRRACPRLPRTRAEPRRRPGPRGLTSPGCPRSRGLGAEPRWRRASVLHVAGRTGAGRASRQRSPLRFHRSGKAKPRRRGSRAAAPGGAGRAGAGPVPGLVLLLAVATGVNVATHLRPATARDNPSQLRRSAPGAAGRDRDHLAGRIRGAACCSSCPLGDLLDGAASWWDVRASRPRARRG